MGLIHRVRGAPRALRCAWLCPWQKRRLRMAREPPAVPLWEAGWALGHPRSPCSPVSRLPCEHRGS